MFTSTIADKYFGMTEDLLSRAAFWYDYLITIHCAVNINLECFIKSYLQQKYQIVVQFPHVAFTVRRDNDPTRWSAGGKNELLAPYGLRVKYYPELDRARETCDPYRQFTMINSTAIYAA